MEDNIGWYLAQAGRIPLLTPAEEIELGNAVKAWQDIKDQPNPNKRICRSGKRAYDRMFEANLRLVVNVARKYLNCTNHMELADLIQEGNLGLSRAVEKFDPSRGYKFSTYAYWWIRQGVRRAMSTQERVIKLPVNAIDVQAKVAKFFDEYMQEHGKAPTVEICAEFCDVRPITMRAYLEHIKRPTSLDRKAHVDEKRDSSGMTLLDLVADSEMGPSEQLEIDSCLIKLDDYLSILEPRAQAVLKHRYGLGLDGECKTFTEIGRLLDMSRERVRQIERKSLKALQRRMLAKADRELAD